MNTIETTGKTVQDATAVAARELGVKADELKITVIEEHKGLFGKATVRVRAEFEGKASKAEPSVAVAEPEPEPVVEASAPEPEPQPAPTAVAEIEEPEATESSREAPRPDATDEDAKSIHALLEGVLKAGDLEVTAKVTGTNGRYVNIELDGKDVAFLVGKHGEVLNALQYVLNIISNQQTGNGIRATLDGNNYRHRREEALTKLATRIADQVKQRGEEAVLDALPAFERRIVHKALADYDGVATYSEGEEPNRRVVIAPSD